MTATKAGPMRIARHRVRTARARTRSPPEPEEADPGPSRRTLEEPLPEPRNLRARTASTAAPASSSVTPWRSGYVDPPTAKAAKAAATGSYGPSTGRSKGSSAASRVTRRQLAAAPYQAMVSETMAVSYTHLRAHET